MARLYGRGAVCASVSARPGDSCYPTRRVFRRPRADGHTRGAIHGIVASMAGAAALTSTAAESMSVAEIGSFHIGGRSASLSGLPTRDVVFTAGSPPVKFDPNGDFEVEQMYVQYVKLARPR